ncbi:T-complex protein 1, beta subunit [Blastocystis sp. ATCC 50177/Nand II]|uniref:T-complex protein 1, beta subunit n=1 Tax=Blastocystis sp. subtype 1 (strain ATCC 50177 / NandII) TaxID=478820 RepID=A0A196SB41_BLAHN|nr:T-complex protein 1, beta subunit [Blastocystis sp. ATCC 50177/Nand II]
MDSFVGATAVADLVKSTLGPKGMDKIIQNVTSTSGSLLITNDGATILKSMTVNNAAAKIMCDLAKIQDQEVGDGTTSVVVLAGELLREAEKLIDEKLHPMVLIEGWRLAQSVAQKALEASAVNHINDEALFYDDLLKIARTTLSSKLVNADKEYFARLAVDAVLRIRDSGNLDYIQILRKPGGSLRDSYLEEGFILEKSFGVGQKRVWEHPRVLLANTAMDSDKIKIHSTRVRVDSIAKVAEIEEAEKAKMRAKVAKILTYKPDVGCKGGAACTLVLRGASSHLLEEAERSLHDALAVLQQTLRHPERTLGGGCAEMVMAEAVEALVPEVRGKRALAVSAFARALRQMPTIIANNAGLDGVELVAELRAAHHAGKKSAGLDIEKNGVGDMEALGIYESLQLKRQVLLSASEAAEMIVRVDEVVQCAPRERVPDDGRH